MKASPIQIFECTIEKIAIEPNPNYKAGETGRGARGEEISIQVFRRVEPAPEYWQDLKPPAKGIEERTYHVALGIRVPSEPESEVPYFFEFVVSGIVGCLPERVGGLTSATAAHEYGLSLLFGVIREHMLSLTSRMKYGERMLPTMSFIGDAAESKASPTAQAAAVQGGAEEV